MALAMSRSAAVRAARHWSSEVRRQVRVFSSGNPDISRKITSGTVITFTRMAFMASARAFSSRLNSASSPAFSATFISLSWASNAFPGSRMPIHPEKPPSPSAPAVMARGWPLPWCAGRASARPRRCRAGARRRGRSTGARPGSLYPSRRRWCPGPARQPRQGVHRHEPVGSAHRVSPREPRVSVVPKRLFTPRSPGARAATGDPATSFGDFRAVSGPCRGCCCWVATEIPSQVPSYRGANAPRTAFPP